MPLPPGWAGERLLRTALEAAFGLPLRLPDTYVVEKPGLRLIVTPSLPEGGLNEVTHCDLDAEAADAAIDAAIGEFRKHGIRFRWKVFPYMRPADLSARLAARGLVALPTIAMARATAGFEGPTDPAITLARVDASNLDTFTPIFAAGFGMSPEPMAPLHRAMLALGDQYSSWIASWNGTPAAAATWTDTGSCAYLIGGVALPEFRGRGLYRALVATRLAEAAARGHDIAITHASADTSAPILARNGFEEVCRFPTFRFSGP